ncbi:MoxR family ATPase [bacterium]|nr:MoxR family ATPase [bacterium]
MNNLNKDTAPEVIQVKETADCFFANMNKVMVGKQETIRLVFTALLCEGHVLIEDVPGTGKTQLAKAVTRSLDCEFKRIQCTPDLLPSDVTGIHFFNQMSSKFEFRPGPVIANIVLVDEINRALPRTQSCLLECMQERQITVDTDTVALPRPFMILATQNPVELEGTFPLPEAQLDRFLLRTELGYPTNKEENDILTRFQVEDPLEKMESVIKTDELLKSQKICRHVLVDDSIRNYIVNLSAATRQHPQIKLGTSPRASLGLQLAAQAFAAINGRSFVIPDDVKALAVSVLAHRLIVKTDARLKGKSEKEIIQEILSEVKVPVEDIKNV